MTWKRGDLVDGNYIKLSRGLLDWEWYTDINTTRLFIHMLLKANWKDGNFKALWSFSLLTALKALPVHSFYC